MKVDPSNNVLDVYRQSGCVVYLDVDISALFVQQEQWENVPDQQRLMLIAEAANQCKTAHGEARTPLCVVDNGSGSLLGLEGEAY
jgi:hypothetical protein